MTSQKQIWKSVAIKELLESQIGGLWGAPKGESEIDVNVVRVTELQPNGGFDPATAVVRSISKSQLSSRKLKEGDLVLEKSGGGPNQPVGRVGLVGSIDHETICSNFMLLMRPNRELVNPRYLWLFLTYLHLTGQTIPLQSSSTNIRNINTTDYLNSHVPLPSLEEQKNLVEFLESNLTQLDKALIDIEGGLDKTVFLRRALLRSAFSGKLVPGVPVGELLPLSSMGNWKGGGTPSKSNQSYWLEGTVPWLTPKDMRGFKTSSTQDLITEAAIENSSASLLPAGAVVVVARSGILERKLPVTVTEVSVTVNQDMKALSCREDIEPTWVAYGLLAFEQEILNTCRKAGTTVANLNFQEFLRFELPVPDKKTQLQILDVITNRLSELEESISALSSAHYKCSVLRQSIFHKVFTVKPIPKDSND